MDRQTIKGVPSCPYGFSGDKILLQTVSEIVKTSLLCAKLLIFYIVCSLVEFLEYNEVLTIRFPLNH